MNTLQDTQQARDKAALELCEAWAEAGQAAKAARAARIRFGEAFQAAHSLNKKVAALGGQAISLPMGAGYSDERVTPEVDQLAETLQKRLGGGL